MPVSIGAVTHKHPPVLGNKEAATPAVPVEPVADSLSLRVQVGGSSFVFGVTEILLWLSLAGWIFYDRLLKDKINRSFSALTEPLAEERRINQLLAQIGVLIEAQRVSLGIFHNGTLGACGYHFVKFSVTNTYSRDGSTGDAMRLRDVPLGSIIQELDDLIRPNDPVKRLVIRATDPHLREACRDYLRRNQVEGYIMFLVRVHDVNIGLVGIQYPTIAALDHGVVLLERFEETVQVLADEINAILRKRLLQPSKLKNFAVSVAKVGLRFKSPV